MSEELRSTNQLVEEIYERLSAFRSASEQLAENAKQTNATSESWKTLTVNFSKTVEDTREGIESVVNASRDAVELARSAHDDVRIVTSQLKEIDIGARFNSLSAGQKEIRELLIDLQTKQQERIRSIDVSLNEFRSSAKHSMQVLVIFNTLVLIVALLLFFRSQ